MVLSSTVGLRGGGGLSRWAGALVVESRLPGTVSHWSIRSCNSNNPPHHFLFTSRSFPAYRVASYEKSSVESISRSLDRLPQRVNVNQNNTFITLLCYIGASVVRNLLAVAEHADFTELIA